ncbi:MAG: hypothetical protein ACHQ6U_12250 [Thermodesulfobacteriota bacterium]
MGEVGTFPFGWVRGNGGDNWQIIWNPKTKAVFAAGAVSKNVLLLGESSSWEEAKRFADRVISDPESYFSGPA